MLREAILDRNIKYWSAKEVSFCQSCKAKGMQIAEWRHDLGEEVSTRPIRFVLVALMLPLSPVESLRDYYLHPGMIFAISRDVIL